MQKRGLAEMNAAGVTLRLVKLQRPPPEMRIFSPGAFECSTTRTLRPRFAASAAHIIPAAPAPITTTSRLSMSAGKRSLARSPNNYGVNVGFSPTQGDDPMLTCHGKD